MSIVSKSDIRELFTPSLSTDDVTDDELQGKIDMVEDYVSAVYFNDTTPSSANAKYPIIMLVLSKTINSHIMKKYGIPKSVSIGDFKYSLAVSGSGKSATDVARTWEEMAIEILKARGTYHWRIWMAND